MTRGKDERNNTKRKVGREYFASTSYTGTHPIYGTVTRVDENNYYTEDDLPPYWHNLSSDDKEDWLNNVATGGPYGRTFPVPTAWTSGYSYMIYPEGIGEDSPEAQEIDDWYEEGGDNFVSDAPYSTVINERNSKGEWVQIPEPEER
jgi:hypothetical protein